MVMMFNSYTTKKKNIKWDLIIKNKSKKNRHILEMDIFLFKSRHLIKTLRKIIRECNK
jgi:ADP-glucose pyrophosphorylase